MPRTPPQIQIKQRHKYSKRHMIVFLVICLCLTLVAFEFTLRWVGLGDPLLYRTNSSYRYALLPNQHKERIRGAKVTIDSNGLRTVQDWAKPNSLRILFIGDSVTWAGTAIDDTKTFAHQVGINIEQKLHYPVVIGNAGVNGYGVDNMTARLQHENLGEDLLIVVLISGDSIRGLADIRSSYFFTRKPPYPLPALWEFTTFSLWRISAYMRLIPPTVDPDANTVATNSLNRLFTVLREKQSTGTPVLLVLSPYEDELSENLGELTQHVRATLASSGIEFLDLYPIVSGLTGESLYSDGVHLNEHGHSVYAHQISNILVKQYRGLMEQHTGTRQP